MTAKAAAIDGTRTVAGRIRHLLGFAASNTAARHAEPETGLLAVLRGHGYGPSADDLGVWVPCRVPVVQARSCTARPTVSDL